MYMWNVGDDMDDIVSPDRLFSSLAGYEHKFAETVRFLYTSYPSPECPLFFYIFLFCPSWVNSVVTKTIRERHLQTTGYTHAIASAHGPLPRLPAFQMLLRCYSCGIMNYVLCICYIFMTSREFVFVVKQI